VHVRLLVWVVVGGEETMLTQLKASVDWEKTSAIANRFTYA
jgi:hypothetical protein